MSSWPLLSWVSWVRVPVPHSCSKAVRLVAGCIRTLSHRTFSWLTFPERSADKTMTTREMENHSPPLVQPRIVCDQTQFLSSLGASHPRPEEHLAKSRDDSEGWSRETRPRQPRSATSLFLAYNFPQLQPPDCDSGCQEAGSLPKFDPGTRGKVPVAIMPCRAVIGRRGGCPRRAYPASLLAEKSRRR